MASESINTRVEPVFFLNSEVSQEAGKWLDTLEVCLAVCEIVSDQNYVEGAQRIGGLWRVYLTNMDARIQLLCTGITIRGCQITLKDKNPFINVLGREDVDTTRVYVRNIPLSYDNGEIEKALKSKKAQLIGQIKYVRARTKEGKLTNFKTGDRFVDIITPNEPLPKTVEMGLFKASVYHKEQKQSKNEIECGNCRGKGHVRRECTNEPVCYDCSKPGHKRGSEDCPEIRKKFGLEINAQTSTMLENLVQEAEKQVSDTKDDSETDEDDYDDYDEDEDKLGKGEDNTKTVNENASSNISENTSEMRKRCEKDAKLKSIQGRQTLISKLWPSGASPANSPGTSPSHSPVSSPRARRKADRSPELSGGKETEKKEKKKKKH